MFSLVCTVRVSPAKVVEYKLKREFRSLEEAKEVAEKNKLAVAYRVFEGGYRVFSKKITKGA